jgi:hypothetical protein
MRASFGEKAFCVVPLQSQTQLKTSCSRWSRNLNYLNHNVFYFRRQHQQLAKHPQKPAFSGTPLEPTSSRAQGKYNPEPLERVDSSGMLSMLSL